MKAARWALAAIPHVYNLGFLRGIETTQAGDPRCAWKATDYFACNSVAWGLLLAESSGRRSLKRCGGAYYKQQATPV
jgi:hypothetical protein